MTLDEAAAQVLLVERTSQPSEPANAPFERRFSNRERNPFFGWNPTPHSIRSYRILDAVLDGRFRGLFNSGGFIQGTGYLVPDHFIETLVIDNARLVTAPDDSTVIVGCNMLHKNYFHWITQALPAIDFYLRRPEPLRNGCLALPALNTWQEESLRLLGYGEPGRLVVDPDKQYAVHAIEYNEILNGGSAFCPSEMARQTYSRLRQAVERSRLERKRIYVARTDSTRRYMRDEAVIVEEVRKRGFEIVVAGDLNFTDQIRLFREAVLVVGPHGAGMTNIVFCDPGTLVYELLPSHYPNACFCNLAHTCKLRYWADAFESDGGGPVHLRDWESDTSLVIDRLDEIASLSAELLKEAAARPITAMDFLRGAPGRLTGHEDVTRSIAPEATPSMLRRLRRILLGRH
jgi:hypothetical protein